MIFSYWDREDIGPIRDTLVDWRAHFPEFSIFSDHDVEPIITQFFPERLDMFRRVRIPACKSDIALLLLLYKFGGLFVDCHCGIRDPEAIRLLLLSLDYWELILYDKRRTKEKRPSYVIHPLNSVIFARRNSPILMDVANMAFQNLLRHYENEKKYGFQPYDIWTLSGPGNLAETILVPGAIPSRLRENYLGRLCLIPEGEGEPIGRAIHYSYRLPAMHWSERQNHEVLFRHD